MHASVGGKACLATVDSDKTRSATMCVCIPIISIRLRLLLILLLLLLLILLRLLIIHLLVSPTFISLHSMIINAVHIHGDDAQTVATIIA